MPSLLPAFPVLRRFVHVVVPLGDDQVLCLRQWPKPASGEVPEWGTEMDEDVQEPSWVLPFAEVALGDDGLWIERGVNEALVAFGVRAASGLCVRLVEWTSENGAHHVMVQPLRVDAQSSGTWVGQRPPEVDLEPGVEFGVCDPTLEEFYEEPFTTLFRDLLDLSQSALPASVGVFTEGFVLIARAEVQGRLLGTVHLSIPTSLGFAKLPTFASRAALDAAAFALGIEDTLWEVGAYRDAGGTWCRVVCGRVDQFKPTVIPGRVVPAEEEGGEPIVVEDTLDHPGRIDVVALQGRPWAVFGPLVEARITADLPAPVAVPADEVSVPATPEVTQKAKAKVKKKPSTSG